MTSSTARPSAFRGVPQALRTLTPLLLCVLGACGGEVTGFAGDGEGAAAGGDRGLAGDTPGGVGTGPYAAERDLCVAEINRYRETLGRPPLRRSAALEAYGDEAAKADAASKKPHGHFAATRGGGVSMAENAIPGWPLAGSSVAGIVRDGLKMMWNEGPGGGHYETMASRRYTEVGCGFAVTGKNEVWALQEFR